MNRPAKKGRMKLIKKEIIQSIKAELSKIHAIKSLTVVGSHADLDKPITSINDLDLLIIVDVLSRHNYIKINRSLKDIAVRYCSTNIGVYVEKRIGPVKLKTNKKCNIILHQILFDTNGYKEYCKLSPLTAYDWQRFLPLIGVDCSKICNVKKITYSDISNKRLGINHYVDMIKSNKIACLDYKLTNGIMKKNISMVNMSDKDKVQLIANGLFQTMNNILKVESNKNSSRSKEQLSKEFFNRFPMPKYKSFFNNIMLLKTKLIEKDEVSFEINSIEKKGIEFFNDIKDNTCQKN